MKVSVALLVVGVLLTACPQGATPSPSPVGAVGGSPTLTAGPTETPEPTQTADPTEAAEPMETAEEAITGGCLAVEQPEELPATHLEEGETFDDYSSDPPSSGPHDPEWEEDGTIYDFEAVSLTKLVHSMEHGTVIFWTNDLTEEEIALAEEAVDTIYAQGYGGLIMVHDFPMDARFVMTAWGYYQECPGVDAETGQVMQLFVDSYYASGPANGEGAIACARYEQARELPGCEKWADQFP